MTIKIFVFNQLTKEVVIDNTIEVNSGIDIAKANHEAFREMFPNCQVNFVIDQDNYLMSPALNMMLDEQEHKNGNMTWDEYITKWYPEASYDCNED